MLRTICTSCRQPEFSCYCDDVQKFDPKISFAILIHPKEYRRRIASGKMSHLCLENSMLIRGHDYTHDERVNAILSDESVYPVILYPGPRSVNLTPLSVEQRVDLFPKNKKLVVFVIDGTWNTAKKTMHLSQNLRALPQICFTPEKPSNFRVRKQPTPECYSTLEAIHHTIELLGESQGFDVSSREQDNLLVLFDKMVQRQIDFFESNPKSLRSLANR